jgi:hypothetical protein
MKRLPEKLVMAVVILSCGFVVQADPSGQLRPVKHSTSGSRHIWQSVPDAATFSHPYKMTRSPAARSEFP